MVICGSIDMTHFDGGPRLALEGTIDADVYDISLAADSELRVDLTGTGAEALDDVEVLVLDTMGERAMTASTSLRNHGVCLDVVPVGRPPTSSPMFAEAPRPRRCR